MNTYEQDEIEIDLRELLCVVLSRLWLIILVGVVFAGGTAGYCKFIATPLYTSTTQLYILGSSAGISSLTDLTMGAQIAQDYIVVTQSRPVVEEVIRNLELDMDYEELLDVTTVENLSNTRMLSISVTDPDPTLAKEIVDQYARVSGARIAEIMEISEPRVVERGYVADKKTSPATTKNTVIAGILGLVLAAAIVVIRHLLDDTIKSADDIERYLGINTLGTLPIEDQALLEEQREQMGKQTGAQGVLQNVRSIFDKGGKK